jgi:hypothetical protein
VGLQIPVETLTQIYDLSVSTTPLDTTIKGRYNSDGNPAGVSLIQLACEFHKSNNGKSAGYFYQYTLSQISDDRECDFGQVADPASD